MPDANEAPAAPPNGQSAEEAKKIIFNSFAGKLCPMSMAAARSNASQGPVLTHVGRPISEQGNHEPEVLGCQGPNCMWFRIVHDETGRAVGGQCAATLIAQGLALLPHNLGGMLAQLGKIHLQPHGG